MSAHPPEHMAGGSLRLWFTPIPDPRGGTHGGVPHSGTGGGVPGPHLQPRAQISPVSVRDRLAGSVDPNPAGDRYGPERGHDQSGDRRGQRDGIRVPELERHDDRGRLPGREADRSPADGVSNLPAPMAAEHQTDRRDSGNDPIRRSDPFTDRSSAGERRISADDRQDHVPVPAAGADGGQRHSLGGDAEQPGRSLADRGDLGELGERGENSGSVPDDAGAFARHGEAPGEWQPDDGVMPESSADNGAHELPLESVQRAIQDSIGQHSSALASVLNRLVADPHPLGITSALRDPHMHARTVELVAGLTSFRELTRYGDDLEAYRSENPGHGPLFESIEPHINMDADGRSRKNEYVAAAKLRDEARTVGRNPSEADRAAVNEYAHRLAGLVEPSVENELNAIAEDLRKEFGDMTVSVRSKDGDGLLDKVQRMLLGRAGAPGRPNYEVGDVIDAVGGRITVHDMKALAAVFERVKNHFGTGDAGRILEIENMYAHPKSKAPSYRVIPMIIKSEVNGMPYTFELQLTTQRASIAADIEHNTFYKPYVSISSYEEDLILRLMAEAAAQDQAETRE
ncbi:hypothetical protein C5E45_18310 [Nocardia nova]|uniref:Uncharacterized protein n=2 Tax=Nocardia nova TaxID=37330 RepID=A0A2S6ANS7_9NOCA|nr:hypothetical protein C5E45_18310 [Nocardia nova]